MNTGFFEMWRFCRRDFRWSIKTKSSESMRWNKSSWRIHSVIVNTFKKKNKTHVARRKSKKWKTLKKKTLKFCENKKKEQNSNESDKPLKYYA